MKVGDLVKNVYTKELGLVTEIDSNEYVVVSGIALVPIDHLAVINEEG